MKKNQKKILTVLLLILLFLIGLFFYSNSLKVKNRTISDNNKSQISKENVIKLTVADKIYKVSIKDGDTIYDTMNTLQNNKENNFSFKSKEFADMGYFIEEINGIKGEVGKYWVYSVNGEKASVSVSKYILKNGDNVLWEQKAF